MPNFILKCLKEELRLLKLEGCILLMYVGVAGVLTLQPDRPGASRCCAFSAATCSSIASPGQPWPAQLRSENHLSGLLYYENGKSLVLSDRVQSVVLNSVISLIKLKRCQKCNTIVNVLLNDNLLAHTGSYCGWATAESQNLCFLTPDCWLCFTGISNRLYEYQIHIINNTCIFLRIAEPDHLL